MSQAVRKIARSARIITEAAALLNEHAASIKECNTINEKFTDGECKADYDNHKRIAKELLNLAKVEAHD